MARKRWRQGSASACCQSPNEGTVPRCGRASRRRRAFDQLDLQSAGMEFALEMVVKARLLGMKMSEVPTTLSVDGRGGPSHLKTWRDGRRSLLLYLASMPSGFLLYPGAVLATLA